MTDNTDEQAAIHRLFPKADRSVDSSDEQTQQQTEAGQDEAGNGGGVGDPDSTPTEELALVRRLFGRQTSEQSQQDD